MCGRSRLGGMAGGAKSEGGGNDTKTIDFQKEYRINTKQVQYQVPVCIYDALSSKSRPIEGARRSGSIREQRCFVFQQQTMCPTGDAQGYRRCIFLTTRRPSAHTGRRYYTSSNIQCGTPIKKTSNEQRRADLFRNVIISGVVTLIGSCSKAPSL